MTLTDTEFVFEPFASTTEYRTVNTAIVRDWIDTMVQMGSREVERLLDIATGVGTMAQLFLNNLPEQWKQPAVLCVDKSKEALKQAKASLEPVVENLELFHVSAEEMDLPDNSVDVAVWGNGIHYLSLEAQQKALQAMRKVLKVGGWFFFNSAFYAEARPPETLPFYRAQVRRAVEYLRAWGVSRERGEGRPEASNFLPREQYEKLLQGVGFKIEEVQEVAAHIRRTAWENISGFQQYAAGALHGYRPDAAAEAMKAAVGPALEEHGFRDRRGDLRIPRNWLAISARAL